MSEPPKLNDTDAIYDRSQALKAEITARQGEIAKINQSARNDYYIPKIKLLLATLVTHYPGLWFSMDSDECDGKYPECKFFIGGNEAWGYLSVNEFNWLKKCDEGVEIKRLAGEYHERFGGFLGAVQP